MSHFHNEGYKLEVLKKFSIAWGKGFEKYVKLQYSKDSHKPVYIHTQLFAMVNNKYVDW